VGRNQSKSKTGEFQIGLQHYCYEIILKESKIRYSLECQSEPQVCADIKVEFILRVKTIEGQADGGAVG
jgi:hypothetical protein